MKSGFNEKELRSIKNKKILKILGFEFDNNYDLIILNGVGAWIANVPTKDVSLNNIETEGKIDVILKSGGIISISHPLPLDNGYPLSSQKGVYCTNYKDIFVPKNDEEKEDKREHTMIL